MYSNKFSKYLSSKKTILKDLVNTLKNDYEFVSVLGTDVKGTRVVVNSKVTNVTPSSINESGFVVKIKDKNCFFEYSFNEITKKNFNELVSKIKEEANKNYNVNYIDAKLDKEEPLIKNFKRVDKNRTYEVNELIDILKEKVNSNIKDDVFHINLMFEAVEYNKIYISDKKELTQYYPWTTGYAVVLTKGEGGVKDAFSADGSNSIYELLNKFDDLIQDAIKKSRLLQKAKAPKPGVYDIIADPGCTGLIVHEAFGHGVEMDMYVKDRAKSIEYMDKQVASPLVTMHDGGKAINCVASYFFDDDGVLSQDTLIIEKGILKRGISDKISASILGTKPTGNSRRESYKRKAYTRMTNTFFEGGKDKLEDMIKSIDHGYLICGSSNGMEDPKSWGIQCSALYGIEIKNGELTDEVIAPVVMSGFVIDLLTSISMVSPDLSVKGAGSCGKGYKEWVRVSDGGSYIKARVKIG